MENLNLNENDNEPIIYKYIDVFKVSTKLYHVKKSK